MPFDYGMDPSLEFEEYLALGVDGMFTDFPGTLHRFFQCKYQKNKKIMTKIALFTDSGYKKQWLIFPAGFYLRGCDRGQEIIRVVVVLVDVVATFF